MSLIPPARPTARRIRDSSQPPGLPPGDLVTGQGRPRAARPPSCARDSALPSLPGSCRELSDDLHPANGGEVATVLIRRAEPLETARSPSKDLSSRWQFGARDDPGTPAVLTRRTAPCPRRQITPGARRRRI